MCVSLDKTRQEIPQYEPRSLEEVITKKISSKRYSVQTYSYVLLDRTTVRMIVSVDVLHESDEMDQSLIC